MSEPEEPFRNHATFWSQFLFLFGLTCMGFFLFPIVAILLCRPFFGIDFLNNPGLLSDYTNNQVVNATLFMQVFYAVGLFALPALTFAQRFSSHLPTFLRTQKPPKMAFWLMLGLVGFVAYTPFESFIEVLSRQIPLPEWAQTAEDKADALVKAFMQADGFSDLLINLGLIALLPAVCEELFFRGMLQSFLLRFLKSHHAAIWITAITFSAFHFQFEGFIARALLGAYLGYLVWWSGSLYTAIWAHFINNGVIVVAYYLQQRGYTNGIFNDDYEFSWPFVLGSVFLTTGVLILAKRYATAPTASTLGENH